MTSAAAISQSTPAQADPSHRPPGRGTASWAHRAAETRAAIERHFAAADGSELHWERTPLKPEEKSKPYAYEWPYSQLHGAVLDLVGMPGGRRFAPDLARVTVGQSRYWKEAGSTGLPGFASYPVGEWGEGGDFFYDDNEWVGLIDCQKYLMFGDQTALAEARLIFDLVLSGWDTDGTHPYPGGVFWTQASWSQDRNTVSNMPGAELGLRLHQITGEQRYLDWSLKMYEWTNTHLQREDGLYHDNVKLDGSIDRTIWSYNQGVPIGVNVLLHQVTGEQRYLDEAQRIADAAEAFYVDGKLEEQPVFFNSIYFKNRLLLDAATRSRHTIAMMDRYATWAWQERREPNGLFIFPNDDPERAELIENAAMVQIMAVLAWPEQNWSLLY